MATYFDDCSSLSGWTEGGVGSGTNYSVSGGTIIVDPYVETLYLNAVESDGDRDDIEILIKVKAASLSTTHQLAIVRGSDSDSVGTLNGYSVGLRSNAIRTYKCVNGAFTQISSTAKTHSDDTYYWARLRCNLSGNTIQARSWADGGSEGGTWECDSTDSTHTGVGYAGLINSPAAYTYTWDSVGVGTNGDTAPASAGGGGLSIPIAMSNYLRQMGS